MKIKSYVTDKSWIETDVEAPAEGAGEPSESKGKSELNRVLSDLVRCKNLVVLTGLGTSLCVKADGKSKAPTMGDLWTAVKAVIDEKANEGHFPKWEQILALVHYKAETENIEELLSRCKLAESFITDDDLKAVTLFVAAAETVIRDKVDFLSSNEDLQTHKAFLRRLGRRSVRRERLKLFTTNYDRCFEHAATDAGFIVVDGFTFAPPFYFDPLHFGYDVVRRNVMTDNPDFIENLFQLYKLHGSIDWQREEGSERIIKTAKADRPLLVYPRSTKYELAFAQPYLEMMSALQRCIRAPETGLLVIGFGFNDNHLSEPILSAIETNLSLKLAVVSPGLEVQSTSNPYLQKMSALIDQGDARLSLIASTFEQLVPAIPDVAAQTDLERHNERVRNMRTSSKWD